MARSLLKEALEDTRMKARGFIEQNRAASAVLAATLIALLAVSVGILRKDSNDPATTLRADQQALTTPTTFYGNSILPLPTTSTLPGLSGLNDTVPTIRLGNGYATPGVTTGTVPGGSTATSVLGHTPTTIAGSAFGTNRIAYVSGGTTYTVNPDGTDPQPVATNAYMPAWAPGHGMLAFVSDDAPGGAMSILNAGGIRGQVTSSTDGSPSIHGNKIAFDRFQSGISSIWSMNRDGTDAHQIGPAGCQNGGPTWSSNGSLIAFWSRDDDCKNGYELYVMNSDGSSVQAVGTSTDATSPSFGPDGRTIAFASNQDSQHGGASGYEIYTINLDSHTQTRLTSSAGADNDPTWSPDGTRIAFYGDRNGGGIYTMKTDGSDVQFVVHGTEPSWAS